VKRSGAGGRGASLLLALALGIVAVTRTLPLLLPSEPAEERALHRFTAADGRTYPYVADIDSYAWLRQARNLRATGSVCDAVVDGRCLDRLAPAPMGGDVRYPRSLHVSAIAALHATLETLRSGVPLEAAAALLPVLVGTLGVLPAFALGRRLGGPAGGFVAAVAIGLSPPFLARSLGGDNDVWNVVLPLGLAWAATRAAAAPRVVAALPWAVAAGGFSALHAATWSGWTLTHAVVTLGLGLEALRRLGHVALAPAPARSVAWHQASVVIVALVAWWTTAGVLVTAVAPEQVYARLPFDLAASVLGGGEAALADPFDAAANWPDVFVTVGELQRPGLAAIAHYLGGAALFFVGWLGLLVLLLPTGPWERWHVAVLIAGTLFYRWLLAAPELGQTALVAGLALPPLAVLVARAWRERDVAEDQSAELVSVCWFLATLLLAFGGLRFVMLLVPPCGLATGAAVGRLHGWLARALGAGRARRVARAALLAGCAGLAAPWVVNGWRVAYAYVPAIDDGWWDALSRIREETPADTIVFAWWDYGYWIEYVAERRVAADGGLLRTHVPYWLARALLATDEAETIGILRMLACGSDATPYPEGAQGGYGRLVRAGVDPLRAPAVLDEIVVMDRSAAGQRLASLGLDAAARDTVLAATHCTPPPALLVVPDGPAPEAWAYFATWDFGRAFAARTARALPETDALDALGTRLGLDAPGARALLDEARAVDGPLAERRFASAPLAPVSRHPCRSEGSDVRCPLRRRVSGSAEWVTDLVWPVGRPQAARFRIAGDDAHLPARDAVPAWLATPGPAGLAVVRSATEDVVPLGVIVDPALPGILVAAPRLLEATHTRLTELDGMGLGRFRPFDDRPLAGGGRLRTWWVDWGDGEASPSP
jgi:dolichyl-diphosphooligosaccharide--protein glycosyltransferase